MAIWDRSKLTLRCAFLQSSFLFIKVLTYRSLLFYFLLTLSYIIK
jgi:hypothetical protein